MSDDAGEREAAFNLRGLKVVVAIPSLKGQIDIRSAGALMEAAAQLGANGAQLGINHVSGCSVLPRARNTLVDAFLESDGTHMFLIDADTVFTADDLIRMICWATAKDVVTGIVPKKQEMPHVFATWPHWKNGAEGLHTHDPKLPLIQLDRIGMAFTCVQRHVLEELVLIHPELQYEDQQGGKTHTALFDFVLKDRKYLGEDYVFCDHLTSAGYEIWADPTLTLSHAGSKDFTGSYAELILNSNATKPVAA